MKNKKQRKTEYKIGTPGLYYFVASNVLAIVYRDGSCEKTYLGGGGVAMDMNLGDLGWYEGFMLPRVEQGWEFVGEI